MKQKLFSYIALSLIVLSTACKKGNDDPKPNNPLPGKDNPIEVKNGKFSAKVNDAAFNVLAVGCIADNEDYNGFVLVATDKTDNSITLTAPNRTGTYTGESTEDAGAIYLEKDGKMWMTDMEGSSFTINITKYSTSTKKMSGTYSFTATAFESTGATGTKVVTGSFEDVNYVTADND
jgi:hypothetical protein